MFQVVVSYWTTMNARSKLLCGAILGNIIGWTLIIFGSWYGGRTFLDHPISQMEKSAGKLKSFRMNMSDLLSVRFIDMIHYLIGMFAFACGVIIVGAYSYLFLVVLAKRTDLLPKGTCKWCCYGPLVYGCIETYRQEIVFDIIPTTP